MSKRNLFFIYACGVLCTIRAIAQSGPGGVGTAASNVLWLKADNGVNLAGASVTGWLDRSGNNNNGSPPSVVARPILVPASLNGYPVVTFDGVNDELRIPDANSLDLQQWDIFLVNSINTAKNNNAWITKGTSTQPNYAMWSTSTNALSMPIYDIFGFLSAPTTAAGTFAATTTLLEYNNTVIFGLFPSRTIFKFGSQIHNDVNLLQLPATNANQLYVGNAQGAAGWNASGSLAEAFVYNTPVNTTQRVIINNYLAAKYGFGLTANDIYVQDNPASGEYDHEMAGIGRLSASSAHLDAQGSGRVRINNATGLGNNEFLLWGHDNGILGAWGSTDFPAGMQGRWFRVWRVSEVNSTGAAVDVGNVDMTFDLTGQGPVTASDLRLLVDINGNGIFADDAPVPIMATSVGGNLYRFAGVSQLVNNRRFTLGTINNAQTPLPVELLYFNAEAQADRSVALNWATASEQDNHHFTVERSIDAADWQDVVEVPSVGNTHETSNYTAWDRDALPGLSYYRLRQVDHDGTTEHSHIVPVRIGPLHQILVFPDPAEDVVNVVLDPALGLPRIRMINELGQVVEPPSIVREGQATLDVSQLRTGSYVVMAVTEQAVITTRMIISR